MFQQTYRRMNEAVLPSKELCQRVLRPQKRIQLRKPLAVAVAVGVAMTCLAVPVIAGSVPQFQELLYDVAPDLVQWMKPVQQSCDSNGIRMEVESVSIEDNRAAIYLSLYDLEGDRLASGVDLYDSYTLQTGQNQSGTCNWVGYDENEKKALFLIQIENQGQIPQGKVSFSLNHFLIGVKEQPVTIPLDELERTPAMVEVAWKGLSGSDWETVDAMKQQDKVSMLVPTRGTPLVEGMELSGLAYRDGFLHLQTAVENVWENDNHESFSLQIGDELRDQLYSVSADFGATADQVLLPQEGQVRTTYFNRPPYRSIELVDDTGAVLPAVPGLVALCVSETVFAVSEEELNDALLVGSVVTSEGMMDGDWNVTFALGS